MPSSAPLSPRRSGGSNVGGPRLSGRRLTIVLAVGMLAAARGSMVNPPSILSPAGAPPLIGSLQFIRYGFMPNRLRYCGGDDNLALFQHAVEGVTDGGLDRLLRKFTGALPYLQL